MGKLNQSPVFAPFEISLSKPGKECAGPVTFA